MELAELSNLIDQYGVKRAERLKADKVAKSLKTEETVFAEAIIATLIDGNSFSASGLEYRVTRHPKTRYIAEDWSAIHKFMIEEDAMDLMEKRVHQGAVKERLDDDVVIPGIGALDQNTLTVGVAGK